MGSLRKSLHKVGVSFLLHLFILFSGLHFCLLFLVDALFFTEEKRCNHGHLLDVLLPFEVFKYFHEDALPERMLVPNLHLLYVQVPEGDTDHLPIFSKLVSILCCREAR